MVLEAAPLSAVELGDVDRELGRITADLGQRAELVVAVEGAVLHALGHHHAGRLLEAHGGGFVRIRQHRHELGDDVVEVGPVVVGGVRGALQVLDADRQVRAVHGEARQQFGHAVGDTVGVDGVGRSGPVAELTGETEHLGPQRPVGDGALGAVDEVVPGRGGPAVQREVDSVERVAAARGR